MKTRLLALLMVLSASPAFAQFGGGVSVTGAVTAGDCAVFSSAYVIRDGGPACAGAGTPLAVANGGTGTGTAFTPGSVVFAGASGVYTQDNANFFYDSTNKLLGLGTATPLVSVDVVYPGIQGATHGAGIQLISDPTAAMAQGDRLGFVGFGGALTASHATDRAAGINSYATQAWTATNAGSQITIFTTPNSTTTGTTAVTIDQDQSMTVVGATTAASFNALTGATGYKLNSAAGLSYPSQDNVANATIALGVGALANMSATSAAYHNTAIGYQALYGTMTTAAVDNTAVGYQAGLADTSGDGGTFIGFQAGQYVSTGRFNTAIGIYALQSNTATKLTGSDNNAIGYAALGAAIGAAANNNAMGYLACGSVTTGSNNVCLGHNVAPTLTTGSSNIFIGASSTLDATATSSANTLKIGNSATPVISATGINSTPATTINGSISMPGMANLNTTVTGAVCWNTGGAVTYNSSTTCLLSSARYKNILKPLTGGLQEVMQMKPMIYTYKEDTHKYGEQVGFIAEDMAKVDKRLVTYTANGELQTVRYENAVAVLAKAIQEQQGVIETLQKRVKALEK